MTNQSINDQVEADSRELKYYRRIINSFDDYRRYSLAINNRRRKDFYRLPLEDQNLLEKYPFKLNEVDDRIRRNADVLDEIVFKAEGSGFAPQPSSHEPQNDISNQGIVHDTESKSEIDDSQSNLEDAGKVRSTLRQLVRDWSTLGSAERQACYDPILDRLEEFANSLTEKVAVKSEIRILIPGSGLGRLVWEIANRGFSAHGNEVSYHMLLASNLVLNHCECINQWSIFPFIHSFSNLSSAGGLLKEVSFPDVLVKDVLEHEDFGVSVGDFTEVFSNPREENQWDAVVTCFFIDTAQNIVQYLKIIYRVLKPHGIWINLGPTLWHHESSSNPRDISIELDIDEVKELCRQVGFEFEPNSEKVIETTYAGNSFSNLKQVYHANYWVCSKK